MAHKKRSPQNVLYNKDSKQQDQLHRTKQILQHEEGQLIVCKGNNDQRHVQKNEKMSIRVTTEVPPRCLK